MRDEYDFSRASVNPYGPMFAPDADQVWSESGSVTGIRVSNLKIVLQQESSQEVVDFD